MSDASAEVTQHQAVYDAASHWKDTCLIDDGSLFSEGSIWTLPNLDQLEEHFVRSPDISSASFLDKLKRQLGAITPEGQQLAAELQWVLLLFPIGKSISYETKLKYIATTWGWSGTVLNRDNPLLGAPLAQGIGKTGIWFNTGRWRELTFMIRFARAFKQNDRTQRIGLLEDPWRFSEWVSKIDEAQQRSMRHIVLHLLFPNYFESIASGGHRTALKRAFAHQIKGQNRTWSTDPLTKMDQELSAIRQALEAANPGTEVHYYKSPFVEQWQAASEEEESGLPLPGLDDTADVGPDHNRRVWVISAGEDGVRWEDFLEQGRIAIGWDELGNLDEYQDRDAIHEAMKRYKAAEDPRNDSLACYEFSKIMREGDCVFAKQGRSRVFGYGIVTGSYTFDESLSDYKHTRTVQWLSRGDWTVPKELRFPPKTLTDVTKFIKFFEYLRPLIKRDEIHTAESEPYGIEEALDGVFLPREEFERILESFRRRKNVILQGSPGVGKSFLARRIAYALVGTKRPDNIQMVQFHQAYAYEDFIQGWRPAEQGGFELRNGVFYEFCRRAQTRPTEPHVFIIDEINRGNLSKILGELMLLIEADKRGSEFAIPLTYSKSELDTFSVPENVFLLGLMNTADRSLAMVDYALRRRFAFIELRPAFRSDVFRRTVAAHGVDAGTLDRITERVEQVNQQITDDRKNLGPGCEIGHSYFCPSGPVTDPATWYQSVIEEEVRPLLEEYWFDDPAQVKHCIDTLLAP